MARPKRSPGKRFSITEIRRASGSTTYLVEGYTLAGERVRERFPDHATAELRRQELEAQATNSVLTVGLVQTRLTESQTFDAERAIAELRPGRTLLEAVRFYNENYREGIAEMLVGDAYELFLAAKEKEGCREDTLRNFRSRVAMLKDKYVERKVHQITRADVAKILQRPGISTTTADNDRRAISSFFSWCLDQEPPFCYENPAKKRNRKRRPTKDDREPVVMPLDRLGRLLKAAVNFKQGRLVPYVVVCTFCAIRPKEAARLPNPAIDLEAKTITVGPKVAKLRERRILEIPDVAVLWLKRYLKSDLPIKPANWRKDFDHIKKEAGYGSPTEEMPSLEPWPQDVLRATGISYRYELKKHEGEVAAWAGTSPNIIHKHYRGLVRPADVTIFWNFEPDVVLGDQRL